MGSVSVNPFLVKTSSFWVAADMIKVADRFSSIKEMETISAWYTKIQDTDSVVSNQTKTISLWVSQSLFYRRHSRILFSTILAKWRLTVKIWHTLTHSTFSKSLIKDKPFTDSTKLWIHSCRSLMDLWMQALWIWQLTNPDSFSLLTSRPLSTQLISAQILRSSTKHFRNA